jgi:hypothetical protein
MEKHINLKRQASIITGGLVGHSACTLKFPNIPVIIGQAVGLAATIMHGQACSDGGIKIKVRED